MKLTQSGDRVAPRVGTKFINIFYSLALLFVHGNLYKTSVLSVFCGRSSTVCGGPGINSATRDIMVRLS